jgi:adenylyltransferase/sulfurtransferase
MADEPVRKNASRRYDRQERFAPIGREGQERIRAARLLVVGCGALGSVAADLLVRAGVGALTVVDRDLIEIHNLQRQILFNEADLANGLPKAVAAEAHLRAINAEVRVRGIAADVNHASVRGLTGEIDLIIDATDNFETRHLINDIALDRGLPWVYGGAVGADGMVKAVIPGRTSCFRCLIDGVPAPGETPTCDTAGIIAPTSVTVAALQVSTALRIITGAPETGDLLVLDAWDFSLRRIAAPRLASCPACVRGERAWLRGERGARASALCGRDMVQVLPVEETTLDLKKLARRLEGLGKLTDRHFYLQFEDGSLVFSIFADGRCLVKGTDDPARARAAVARYLGG